MLLRLLLILIISVLAYCSTESDDYRLPKNVKPIRYNLTIVPNFETDTFSGSVLIEIKALQSSNYITLHVLNLSMPLKEDIVVKKLGTSRPIAIKSAEPTNVEYQFFTITLNEKLKIGNTYVLKIPNFSGRFAKTVGGFTSGTFLDTDGSTRLYAFTQFQATEARRVFPCFDEPALRAKFNVKLVRPNNNFISASNSPLISQSTTAPYEDVYEETVNMPTYLLAFTISEMRFSEPLDIFRIIARPEALNNGLHEYSLHLTVDVIDFMETFTGIPFILPKLDEVAIPIFPGAMENWGLIVYGERYLLLNRPEDKENIVPVVAHEIAHQWFGNLVGITWWKYIWLNEGSANYFENLISGLVESDIDGRGLFQFSLHTVFKVDGRSDTRPLTQNAKTPSDILFLFDSIGYRKGGALLRMIEKAITTPVYQKGIQYYVEKMQFKQATPMDLYESLQKAVDESEVKLPRFFTVADIMCPWESVKGYPVVYVRRTYGANRKNVYLEQTKFITTPNGPNGDWIIPINFATKRNPSFENTDPDHWMTSNKQKISVPNLYNNDWLIANKMETGYYRVNYDDTNWNLIIRTLKTSHLDIHVLNRAQLVDDSMNLASTGRLNENISLDLLEYLQNEQDLIPWRAYAINTLPLRSMFYYSPNYDIFKTHVFSVMKKVYDRIGFEKRFAESNLQKELRKIVLRLLCNMDHPDCLAKSLDKFNLLQKYKNSLLEIDEFTLCGAVRKGGQEIFDNLLEILGNENLVRMNIIKGLSCSTSTKNLNKLLKLQNKLPMEELIEIVADAGPEGLDVAVTFISQHFAEIEEKLYGKIGLLLRKISDLVSTQSHLNKIRSAMSQSKNVVYFEKIFTHSEENIKRRNNDLNRYIELLQKRI